MNRKMSGILAGSIGAFLFGAVLLVHAQDAPPPPPPPEADILGVEMGGGAASRGEGRAVLRSVER